MSDEPQTVFQDGREYEAESGLPVWPYRHRELPSLARDPQKAANEKGPLIDNDYVRLQIERLDNLERETRPSGGAATAEGKDMVAQIALGIAGDLIEHVAGWALAHQLGLAERGLAFVPFVPVQNETHPDYLAAKSKVDDHAHERAGGLSRLNGKLAPEVQRQALINLLRSNSGGWPLSVQQPALIALQELAYEQVVPMLQPATGTRKVGLRRMRLQLRTVGFVTFKVATGMRKYEAQDIAAKALPFGRDTINGWEFRLRESLGALEVSNALAGFANWGASFKKAQQAMLEGQEYAADRMEIYEDLGGMPELQRIKAGFLSLHEEDKSRGK